MENGQLFRFYSEWVKKPVIFLKILIITSIIAPLPQSLSSQIPGSDQEFIPEKGAKGKDVIWLPTPDLLINAMMEMAKVIPGDIFFDLGSGDGCVVIEAAKRGAFAIGIEYERELVELSRVRAAQQGVSENTVFYQADLFEFDFSEATVISLFLLPDLNLRIRSRLLALNPGTRIISNSFDMGEWEADDQILVEYIEEEHNGISSTIQLKKAKAFYWIVPEKIEGKWISEKGELHFKQNFQKISGTFKTETDNIEIQAGKLIGNEISFEMNNEEFTGIVFDHQIIGTITSNKTTRKWIATRKTSKN